MTFKRRFGAHWLWDQVRHSRLWSVLRRVPFLRNSLYLALELRRTLQEPQITTREIIDKEFTARQDPWKYETDPTERKRFLEETAVLDEAREGRLFPSALEIGCAEGAYTEVLAARCQSLLVLELSPTALGRAQGRRQWSDRVRFESFDLRCEPIPDTGTYDLIVVTALLEYFKRPLTLFRIREKLTAALRPDGYLLVETTRANPVVENSWWGRRLIRGKWINAFISDHPSLAVISSAVSECYTITLCRKTQPAAVGDEVAARALPATIPESVHRVL